MTLEFKNPLVAIAASIAWAALMTGCIVGMYLTCEARMPPAFGCLNGMLSGVLMTTKVQLARTFEAHEEE